MPILQWFRCVLLPPAFLYFFSICTSGNAARSNDCGYRVEFASVVIRYNQRGIFRRAGNSAA